MIPIYYFGCWGGAGHHLWTCDGRRAEAAGPFADRSLDVRHCGDPALATYRYAYRGVDGGREWDAREDRQPQGKARLVHVESWTVLAFWDRTGDPRYGSNSAFVAEGTLTAAEIAALAAEAFPAIWARIQTIPGGLVLPDETATKARGAMKDARS